MLHLPGRWRGLEMDAEQRKKGVNYGLDRHIIPKESRIASMKNASGV